LRPLPGGRRLAAARTGVSDCAGFAPNEPQPRLALAALSLTPCHPPSTPFRPFYRSALFLPAAALVKEETSRKRQKGKKHEIRRSQHTNERGRGFPRCSIGVRSQ